MQKNKRLWFTRMWVGVIEIDLKLTKFTEAFDFRKSHVQIVEKIPFPRSKPGWMGKRQYISEISLGWGRK